MSGDPATTQATWDNIAILSGHRGRPHDAVAAGQRARAFNLSRRELLYASVCHARIALAHASTGDARAAQRSLSRAEESLAKARNEERSRWTGFYDLAELNGLSAVVFLRLGQPDRAEYHAHATLARLWPGLLRNRAFYTAQLELACATADRLLTRDLPDTARVRALLKTFRSEAAATGVFSTMVRKLHDPAPAESACRASSTVRDSVAGE